MKRVHHKHMKLFINILMKRIYLFYTVRWNYWKKIEFSVCKKKNFAGLGAHRKHRKSTRASPTLHHTSIEEWSACFIAQTLSPLVRRSNLKWRLPAVLLLRGGRAGDQGLILTLANSQNASDFDNLRVKKISTSKRFRVRIIHVSQTKGKNLLLVSPAC